VWWFQWKLLKFTQFVDPIKGSSRAFFHNFSSIYICKIYNHQSNLDCSVTTEIIKKCRQTGKRSQRWISGEMSHCTCCRPYMRTGSKLYLRVVQQHNKIVRPYIYIYIPKNEAQKVKKRDLGRPEGRRWGLKFFFSVPSHIRCTWRGSKLVHWLERRQNQIAYKI